jgi:class 3 adenylate cyclase
LKIPGIVVFAGHLIDRPERSTARFPAELEPAVRAAIQSRIKKIAPGFGYASAGCGADILFFEALLESGGEAHVVLPYEKEQFIKDSVAFANSDWVNRFERILERATSVTTASSERIEEGSMSFEYANLLLFGLAEIRARQLETNLVPLAIWDKKPGDGPGGTASVVEHWQNLDLDVQVIDLAKILKREIGVRVKTRTAGSRGTRQSKGRGSAKASLPTRIMAMLFADAVNFSKLTEQQIPLFLNYFLGAIGKLISTSPHAPIIKNTWGDGLYFVFDDVKHAGLFALELCELMVQTNWGKTGLPRAINLRIALHAGPVYACVDPVTEQPSYTGTHVSRAARIEPITPPGQVYASQAFAALAAAQGVRNSRATMSARLHSQKATALLPPTTSRTPGLPNNRNSWLISNSNTGHSLAIAMPTRSGRSGCTNRSKHIVFHANWWVAQLQMARSPKNFFPFFVIVTSCRVLPISAARFKKALTTSRSLIVICSPKSAVSKWVNEEVKAYKTLGHANRVFCLMIDGEPNAAPDSGLLECFHAPFVFKSMRRARLSRSLRNQ